MRSSGVGEGREGREATDWELLVTFSREEKAPRRSREARWAHRSFLGR